MKPSLHDVVWAAKPALQELVRTHGSASLTEYFELSAPAPSLTSEARWQELRSVLYEEIARTLGPTVAMSALNQLRQTQFISTADHHGPLTHPFFLNSNLVQYAVNRAAGLNHIFVLACSSVSFNNSSFPRGSLFHDAALNEQRVHFIPWKHHREPVYGSEPYASADIARELAAAKNVALSHEAQARLGDYLDRISGSISLLAQTTYSDQITLHNYHCWQHITRDIESSLIYLEQEAIVRELLVRYHLGKGTAIDALITDEKLLSAYERHFDGIQGAHAKAPEKGTVLFWGKRDGRRIALWHKNGALVSHDGTFEVALNPQDIKAMLERGELFPGMALSFIVLSFYYSLHCGGGFSQIDYLAAMQSAYKAFLTEAGITREQDVAEKPATRRFRGEFVLATIGDGKAVVPATALDLLLYGNERTMHNIVHRAKATTLADAIERMMPEYCKIITGKLPSASSHQLAGEQPLLYV